MVQSIPSYTYRFTIHPSQRLGEEKTPNGSLSHPVPVISFIQVQVEVPLPPFPLCALPFLLFALLLCSSEDAGVHLITMPRPNMRQTLSELCNRAIPLSLFASLPKKRQKSVFQTRSSGLPGKKQEVLLQSRISHEVVTTQLPFCAQAKRSPALYLAEIYSSCF